MITFVAPGAPFFMLLCAPVTNLKLLHANMLFCETDLEPASLNLPFIGGGGKNKALRLGRIIFETWK